MKDYTSEQLSRNAAAAADLVKALATDDKDLAHDMVEGETDFFEAVQRALDEIAECEIQAAGIADMKKRLTDRETRVKNRKEKLRGLIDQAFQMAEIKSHKFACATITTKATQPQLVIEDESQIPSDYFTPQPPKLDKVALKNAAKSEAIPGARMSNGGTSIQIRWA